MNKISKKIVALVTMAAFVLTLVPAAAFAATVTSESTVNVPEKYQELTLDAATGQTATVEIKVSENIAEKGQNVYVWVEKDGKVYSDVTYIKDDKISFDVTSNKTGDLKWAGRLQNPAAGTYNVQINFKNAGEYTVHAGIEIGTPQQQAGFAQNIDELTLFDVAQYGSNTIVVKDAETTVNQISFSNSIDQNEKSITVTPNSFSVESITAYVSGVYSGTENAANVDTKVVSIKNDNENKGVYVYKAGTETTINEATVKNGQISFDVQAVNGAVAGKYPITLSCDGEEATLYVTVDGNSKATSIEVVDSDSQYVNMEAPNFTGVSEVIFKDADGNATDATVGSDPGQIKLQFVSAPEGFDKSSTITLEKVNNTDKYALKYSGSNLKAGKYTVRLGIVGQTASSAVVELSFTAVKVGDTVALEIDTDNDAETIVSGGKVTGTVYAVDANGIKTAAKRSDVKLGFVNSAAVDLGNGKTDVSLSNGNGSFTVYAKDAEKYYGSKITLIAFDENAKVQATKELTVVDGMTTNTLAFDKEAGSVAKNNTVKVSVVDENGKAVAANGQAYAYVESQSNEDAKVDVSFAKGNSVTDGKIDMTVYSDKETTADIVVAVKDSETNAIYANTLKYTFGEQDIPVGTSVVMTIGSNDFVVNNDVVSVKDAAPYIANDRTYVPFRALGEALGAEVVWDNDARTVTYTLGKTEVVMTIGEKTYTVNGEEKTMDVAPEITGDRTYVPVRFVGEALGFKVTALSAADGTTASVVFQK